MRVQDIMKRKFASFQADDSLDHILETFADKHITSAPVFSKDEFIGILSFSDLPRFFQPRDGVSLPFLEGSQLDQSKKLAASLAKRPPFILTPDQPAMLVAGRLASSQDCIPVMDGKKVVGVVWPECIIDFYLAERAKEEVTKKKASPAAGSKAKLLEEENSTTIDRILEIVKRDGQTDPKKVAKELGITVTTAEDLASLLGKHKLVKINYSFLSGMVLERIDYGN